MKNFQFVAGNHKLFSGNEIKAIIDSNIKSKDELLSKLSEELLFPDYFGKNWDALYDFLCDFYWIKEKLVYIIHISLPCMDEQNLKIYFKILFDSINLWKDDEEHLLEVIFMEKDREKIERILNDNKKQ